MNIRGRLIVIWTVFVVMGGVFLLSVPALAQEGSGNDFDSRDKLGETIGIDVEANLIAIDELNAENISLQEEIDTNLEESATLQTQIDANQIVIDDPLTDPATVELLNEENDTLQAQIDVNTVESEVLQETINANVETTADLQQQVDFMHDLTDEQVWALNRNLNNTIASGLVLNYDMELLQKIVDEGYDKHQINFLILALEKEAIFLAKYEETGDEKFLLKAESMKNKFLAMIERDQGQHGDIFVEGFEGETPGESIKEEKEAEREARDAAREAEKEARTAVREATKEAREAVREAAKEAREAVREAAKETREASREVAKEAREASREAAKEARDAAKEERMAGKGKPS